MRDPFKLVYCSCYTRGLVPLLQVFFPVLKALEPRVTLHITYGMEGLEESQRRQIKPFLHQPGVFEHGRVPLDQVVALKRSAAFHLYYTASHIECDCISVRESALLGAVPVLSKHHVFNERPGIHLGGDPNNAEDASHAARQLFALAYATQTAAQGGRAEGAGRSPEKHSEQGFAAHKGNGNGVAALEVGGAAAADKPAARPEARPGGGGGEVRVERIRRDLLAADAPHAKLFDSWSAVAEAWEEHALL